MSVLEPKQFRITNLRIVALLLNDGGLLVLVLVRRHGLGPASLALSCPFVLGGGFTSLLGSLLGSTFGFRRSWG